MRLRRSSADGVRCSSFAAAEIAVPWIFLASAEKRVTSSLAGLLIAAVPLVAVVIAATTGRRERPVPAVLNPLLGLGGVAAIVGLDPERSKRRRAAPSSASSSSATRSVRRSSRASWPTCRRSASSPSR
jgi:hypothetical protein